MTHRLPLITTIVICIQMAMGGLIVGKDAGFVCPDWPLCYGQILPHLTPLLALELVHRLSAMIVGVLVVVTAVLVYIRHRDQRLMVAIVSASLASLLLQIIVGGMIVLFVLPGITTTIDVVNSMVLLSLYVTLTVLVYRQHRARSGNPLPVDTPLFELRKASWLLFAFGLFAIAVGAVFRHSGASQALFGQMSYLESHHQHVPPTLQTSQTLLVFHIFSAALFAFAMMWFLLQSLRLKRLMRLALLELVLLGLQVMFGVWSLGTKLALLPSTLHWSNSAVLVALMALNIGLSQFATREESTTDVTARTIRLTRPNTVR
jgi:cytochrome c oxidase assembly protein subunit 15